MSSDLLFKKRYRIPSARLAGWDYRWAGVYHVTINTQGRVCWFGEIQQGQVVRPVQIGSNETHPVESQPPGF